MRSSRVRRLLASFVLVGLLATCGDDAPSPDDAAAREVEITISDGRVDTAEDRVEVASGSTVRLVVTSDIDDELHVHGVDETADLVAGEPTTLEFTVDEPGSYDVETHRSGTLLVQLLVR
ncbi:MAG: cupredoxin domain-containing protein [Jiangellaceae bacterium]